MRHIKIECGDEVYHFYTTSDVMAPDGPKLVLESKYGNVGQYTYRIDPPHNPENGQTHVHFMEKGNEIFALNMDGSAHDGWHGVRIKNKILDALPKIMPGITLPKNGIIECVYKSCGTAEEVVLYEAYRNEILLENATRFL